MPTKRPPKPEVNEIATAEKDIDMFSGWLGRLENPDPVLRTEARGKGLKLYDEVARDAHAGSVLQTRYLAVVGKEWQVEPGARRKAQGARGRTPKITEEQKTADFVKDVLLSCNHDQARQELLEAILYGFYVWEVMWGYSEGQVWVEKLVGKHPRRFSFTLNRELRLLTPQNMIDGEPVPDRKFIVFSYGSSDNPYGQGLGQSLWWPTWFKKHGIKFWTVFCDKFGSPTPWGKYPPGTSKGDQDKLLSALEAMQQDNALVTPDGMLIELMEAKRSGRDNYEGYCEYMDKQISKRVLGQTATTEGTPGKLGNEQEQGEVRGDIVKADADLLCECENKTLMRWIVDYNVPAQGTGRRAQGYPQIWIRTEPEQDLKGLAERDKIIVADLGYRKMPESYIRDTYGIPEPEAGEELVQPPQASGQFGLQVPGYRLQDVPGARSPEPGAAFAEASDDWVRKYMDTISPTLDTVRDDGLNRIEAWLRGLDEPPGEDAFVAQIQSLLGQAYKGIDEALVADAVSEMYSWYRLKDLLPGIGEAAFGGPDVRAVDFLSKLDNHYVSKFIQNPEARDKINRALQDMYHDQGAGLFGRDPEALAEFRNLLSQELSDLEDWEVRRIVDTSVQRARSWAHIEQLQGVGVVEIVVQEGPGECDFCRTMNGKVIRVEVAHEEKVRQAGMTPEEYEAHLKDAANKPTLDNAESFVARGILPPYHPNCRGRIIKRRARA